MTPAEFLITWGATTITLLLIFYALLLLWVINKAKYSSGLREWAKEWRDKPPFDWMGWLSIFALMWYLLWIKGYHWIKGRDL